MTPEIGQKWGAPYGPPEEWDLSIEDREIEGPYGTVPVRVYNPSKGSEGRPCLIWCHGGGWAFGDLDMAEAHEVSRGIAGRANAVVVSVDYRLCPVPQGFGPAVTGESTTTTEGVPAVHFPIPHTDVMAAYRWVREVSGQLGVDKDRIAIGGASAGANLAAGAALNLRDEGEAPSQVLLSYPVVHPELPQPSEELAGAIASTPSLFLFPPEVLTPLVTSYLGERDDVPAYAFPGTSDSLAGYPRTFIDNAEFDDLRSSGEAFADKLRAAGVHVEQVTTYGVIHGHLNNIGHGPAKASMDRMAKRLRDQV
ncbi:acetyl esterase/lipase [Arthrobacter sp. SLBN-100]|uniref:alpha/beta hydrolase n=1 Tax=Arthrobacter sp. SLBN-100 TaxID=2768450 RepID=UPI00116F620A|nr:alpha/beta hydrolase [Arthrobacter sp. SLBN-100]TQJ66231.1 acetyl esterase/lipase [Arthrobacter sp. SLBN-100]